MAELKYPSDLKYTKSDEWIKVDGGEAVVGVTDYAQNALSDLVYVELPDVGASFKQDASFGTVESVKAASDLHMPISGSVIAVNKDLLDSPEKINDDPYGTAWLVRIKPDNIAELNSLMDVTAYKAYCDERG
ncbi:MAG: glycine cleavage system protein GcvH [Anaerolineae bacterium]|nr:glycine cleavage system protein GcvH [Anaerolineae bacterium]